MTVTLTGTPSAITARTAPVITAPAGTDAPSAASNNQPDQGLLDKLASILAHGGLLDVAGDWSKLQRLLGGVYGAGDGTVPGVQGEGTSGFPGVKAHNPSSGFALEIGNGNVQWTGSYPSSSTDVGLNVMTPICFPKAGGIISSNGSGTITVVGGFNIAAVTRVSAGSDKYFNIAFARSFLNQNYWAQVSINDNGSAPNWEISWEVGFVGAIHVRIFDRGGGVFVDPNSVAAKFSFTAFGQQ